MNINIVTVDCYHQYFLPEYSGVGISILCKANSAVLATITPRGHLEVFKGYSYVGDGGCGDAVLVRDVLLQCYNSRHGVDFYTRRDINIIYCNIMKQCKVGFIRRKVCYFGSVCYCVWEKLIKGY